MNSSVHGSTTLGVVSRSATTTMNYYCYDIKCIIVPWIAFSQGCRERISGLVVIATLQYVNRNIINCLLFSSDAARTLEDASLR